MTINLNLEPELESEIIRRASEHGQSLNGFIEDALRELVVKPKPKRRVASGLGRLKGIGGTVDEFLANKRLDVEAEEVTDRRRLQPSDHQDFADESS